MIDPEDTAALPFRLMAIADSPERIDYILNIADAYPNIPIAVMLRNSMHSGEKVKELYSYLSTVGVPESLYPICNNAIITEAYGAHFSSVLSEALATELQKDDTQSQVETSIHLRDYHGYPGRKGHSVHNADELTVTLRLQPDYILYSPIFTTASKPGHPGLGVENLHSIVASTSLPVIALGGITDETIEMCIRAGAYGVAGISLFQPEQREMLEQVIEYMEHV